MRLLEHDMGLEEAGAQYQACFTDPYASENLEKLQPEKRSLRCQAKRNKDLTVCMVCQKLFEAAPLAKKASASGEQSDLEQE